MANLIKTGFLLIVLTCLLVLVGGALGGQQGMTIAFILALVMNVGSYWFSDKIVLSMYGAQPVEETQAPGLYRIVRELAARAQIPVPPIYMIPDDSPNAFATGSQVIRPRCTFKPLRRCRSSTIARSPLAASASPNGSVAWFSAWLDVAGTAPGMFATQ